MARTHAHRWAALAIVAVLTLPAAGATAPKEQHPLIRKAEVRLVEAKRLLERAAHDFGGHRVKAIEHVTMALDELRLALEYAKERTEEGK